MRTIWVLMPCLALACSAGAATNEERKEEVRKAETGFAATVAKRDHAAFESFLANDAVFFGRQGVSRGKAAVAAAWKGFYQAKDAPFSWRPESVEVLEGGELGLSSGPVFDPTGKQVGTFNSVWRREKDGAWRVVFDKGCPPCDCAARPSNP